MTFKPAGVYFTYRGFDYNAWTAESVTRQAGPTLGSLLIFPRIMDPALSCLYLGSLLIFPRIMTASKQGRPSDHYWFFLGSWNLHCPACTSDHYWFSLGSWLLCSACQLAGQTLGSLLIFPRIMDSALSSLYLGSLLIFPRIMAALPAS